MSDDEDDVLPVYCSQCATPVERVEVGGEPVWRCPSCGHRQFRRQIVGVAVVVVEDGRLLMVQRRYGTDAGSWCIPCGHVGWDEDVREAARRELEEETGLARRARRRLRRAHHVPRSEPSQRGNLVHRSSGRGHVGRRRRRRRCRLLRARRPPVATRLRYRRARHRTAPSRTWVATTSSNRHCRAPSSPRRRAKRVARQERA